MRRAFLALICGAGFVSASHAQPQWPSDVASFIERRDGCDHFRGEEPYNEERRKFLHQRILELCVGTDKQLALLKKKYRGNKTAIAKLNEYEPSIEAAGKQ
jgi:hypothetical protein